MNRHNIFIPKAGALKNGAAWKHIAFGAEAAARGSEHDVLQAGAVEASLLFVKIAGLCSAGLRERGGGRGHRKPLGSPQVRR